MAEFRDDFGASAAAIKDGVQLARQFAHFGAETTLVQFSSQFVGLAHFDLAVRLRRIDVRDQAALIRQVSADITHLLGGL